MPFSRNEPNEETRNRTSHLICQGFVFPPQINPLGTRRGNEKIPRPPSNPGGRDDHLEQHKKSLPKSPGKYNALMRLKRGCSNLMRLLTKPLTVSWGN
ncbi:hypothetical protein TNIN_27171 [Trichonephila inaurata madagascariensis]|uniref:Uncharacterized protein n=1 Tax=Trichonephila inaurata madagascariensis TaxID=2747483 RepID=A0A8X7BVX7_9ARAC|nr:hypothetical protein TNIN_27171 [Trichonephila inaurata madagascariensis]